MERHHLNQLFKKGPVYLFEGTASDTSITIKVSEALNRLLSLNQNMIYYQDLIYPLDEEEIVSIIQDFIELEALYLEIKPHRILSKDQHVFWFNAYIQVERNDQGAISALEGYFIDITPFLIHEDQYIESKERYVTYLKPLMKGFGIGI
ncbi:MAG: hypothetical protein JXR88_09265 [Clostridia bacterium]|nr:hypothetical protein [Clostridia bacterium]